MSVCLSLHVSVLYLRVSKDFLFLCNSYSDMFNLFSRNFSFFSRVFLHSFSILLFLPNACHQISINVRLASFSAISDLTSLTVSAVWSVLLSGMSVFLRV